MAVASMVADAVRAGIAGETFSIDRGTRRIEVTISIGLAILEGKSEGVAELLKRADQALYRAKRDGRNRVVRRRPD